MKKIFLITLFLALTFSFQHALAQDGTDKTGGFKVKLPEGLYLYQPKIDEEVFSPLFIVKDGMLIDPYALAEKIGKEQFIKDYVEGRDFNVYAGRDIIGKLSKVKVEFLNVCETLEFLPDMRLTGKYEGKPFSEIYMDKSLFAIKEPDRPYGAIKAIATPASLKSETSDFFKINQEDKKKASFFTKQKIAPELFENTKKAMEYLQEEKQIITASDERVGFIQAFDIDGNGKKDILGSYILEIYHKDNTENGIYHGGFRGETLFVISDNGNIQTVFSSHEVDPGFSLGGVIDIDQDGVYELIVQENDGNYESGIDNVRRIDVFRRTAAWTSIYHTETICGLDF